MLTLADLKQEIKHHYSEDVFYKYIGKVNRKVILSPLRNEKHPSFALYVDKGEMKFKDFGSGEGGDCIDFICQLKGIDFNAAINEICQEFQIQEIKVNGKEPKPVTTYSFEIKSFSESDLNYWLQYGITEDVLIENNVFALTSFNFSKDGKDYPRYYSEENPIYAYCFTGSVKIYKPLEDKGKKFGWLGSKPENYAFGWDRLPKAARSVIITAGEKDVLSLKSKGFNAICLNSETALLPDTMAADLKRRFANVFVLYDNDRTGIDSSEKLCKTHGFTKITLPEMGINRKDISDFFFLGNTTDKFELLIEKAMHSKHEAFLEELGDNLFDAKKTFVEPTAIISINGETVSTAGNITTLLGQSKSGKSGVCGAILAGGISVPGLPIDTLGIKLLQNKDYKAVLHFDTEQSESDWYKFNHRVMRRAARNEQPSYYHSIHLRKHDIRTRIDVIEKSLAVFNEKHGGIYTVIIDGIADLVTSVNEEKECYQLIDKLMYLSAKYVFPIITIIHLNPNQQGTSLKGRGHLGSHLERKSESVLSIVKEGDISRLEPQFLRNAGLSDMPVLLFRYDKDKGYPVSYGELKNKQIKKEENLRELAKQVFSESSELSANEIVTLLHKFKGIARSRAMDIIADMKQMGYIEQGEAWRSPYTLSFDLRDGVNPISPVSPVDFDDEVPF